MRIKNHKDFWSGLMFVGIGGGFAWGALGYNFGSSARPGPGYFPFGLGVILAVLGLALLFKSLVVEALHAEGGVWQGWAFRPLIWIVGALVVFGWALPRLGLCVSLPMLVVMASRGGTEFRWGEVIVNALILTALCWLVFVVGLSLPLPLWPTWGTVFGVASGAIPGVAGG